MEIITVLEKALDSSDLRGGILALLKQLAPWKFHKEDGDGK